MKNLVASSVLMGMVLSLATVAKADWTKVSGVAARNGYCFATAGSNLFAGTDAGVFLSGDDGATWNAVNSGLSNQIVNAMLASGGTLYAGTQGGGVFISTNSGTTWTAANNGLTDMNIMAFTAIGGNVFVGADGGGVAVTANNGTSWTAVNKGIPNALSKHITALVPNGTTLFALTDGGALVSTDNGANWTAMNSGLVNIVDYTVLCSKGKDVYAGTDKGVFAASLGGTSWTLKSSGLANTNATALAVSGDVIYAGTDLGVFLSSNSAAGWTAANTGLAATSVIGLGVGGTYLYAGTAASGVWRRPLSEVGGNVGITRSASEKSLEFGISPDKKMLHCVLPVASDISVTLRDIKGETVAVIAEGGFSAGAHAWALPGAKLPAGEYSLNLVAGRNTPAKSAILILP